MQSSKYITVIARIAPLKKNASRVAYKKLLVISLYFLTQNIIKNAASVIKIADPKTIDNPDMTHSDLQLSDWWSFGQIVYALFEGANPNPRGWRIYKPRSIPKKYHEILSKLLNDRIKPTERPNPDAIRSVFIDEQ